MSLTQKQKVIGLSAALGVTLLLAFNVATSAVNDVAAATDEPACTVMTADELSSAQGTERYQQATDARFGEARPIETYPIHGFGQGVPDAKITHFTCG